MPVFQSWKNKDQIPSECNPVYNRVVQGGLVPGWILVLEFFYSAESDSFLEPEITRKWLYGSINCQNGPQVLRQSFPIYKKICVWRKRWWFSCLSFSFSCISEYGNGNGSEKIVWQNSYTLYVILIRFVWVELEIIQSSIQLKKLESRVKGCPENNQLFCFSRLTTSYLLLQKLSFKNPNFSR